MKRKGGPAPKTRKRNLNQIQEKRQRPPGRSARALLHAATRRRYLRAAAGAAAAHAFVATAVADHYAAADVAAGSVSHVD